MELTITRTDLLQGLAWTQTVVDRKATMPILANCCLEAKGKSLTIVATDLEVGVTVTCATEAKTAGKITVNARALFDIVKALSDDRVHLKTLPNHWVEVTAGKSKFKVVGLPAEDYPALPQASAAEQVVLGAKDLRDLIDLTAYAMSTDETRYYLNGVLLEQATGEKAEGPAPLRLVATDSHRLAYAERAVHGKWKLGQGVIIPRKGVMELKRLLDGVEGNVTLRIDPKYLAAERDGVTLVVRLIDGQFPPYQQVVPKDHKWIVSVEREAFIQAMRRVQLVTTDRVRGVRFRFSPGHLEITANNPDLGEAYEELPANYKGETFEMGFNARFFQDVLMVLRDEQVVMALKGDLAPCVIRSEYDRQFLALIMPMRLS